MTRLLFQRGAKKFIIFHEREHCRIDENAVNGEIIFKYYLKKRVNKFKKKKLKYQEERVIKRVVGRQLQETLKERRIVPK